MAGTDELTTHLSGVLADLRKAIDTSVAIRSRSKADAKSVAQIWESFLSEFIGYIMKKKRETGHNLLEGISFHNIWRR
ncbi:MAG: hypothetical protein A4E55_02322 [Pelotomaculum sp. PtaU1.Bin035]|nr:MAG: hypothetical protein A4E55_02322 [Pelotomaculum sp. PtaU1.Bin035]